MTESCGTCTHYTPDPDKPGDTLPGFGRCAELNKVQKSDAARVSAWPWGCRFTPSRYEGPDKDPNPYQQMAEGGHTIGIVKGGHTIGIVKDGKLIAVDAEVYVDPKDDRPPLELT